MLNELPSTTERSVDVRHLYLDLLKRCLTFLIWDAADGSFNEVAGPIPIALVFAFRRMAARFRRLDPAVREYGRDWPRRAHTMVGLKRLDNVQECVEDVLRRNVPGDLIEAGVWRGGVTILMRAILKAHNVTDRVVWVADSFSGLPKPNIKDFPQDKGYDLSNFRSLSTSMHTVKSNFAKYQLLDHQVKFLKGWFRDTLPEAPIEKLAVMRLDGDLYESTIDALISLYPKLSQGGYVIIDDYWNSPPCRSAVDDYRRQNQIEEPVRRIDWSGAYWQKTSE